MELRNMLKRTISYTKWKKQIHQNSYVILYLVESILFITLSCNWTFNRDVVSHMFTISFDSNTLHSSSNMWTCWVRNEQRPRPLWRRTCISFGKFVDTGLKEMTVKFATIWNERKAIIQKYEYYMIAGITMYSENLIGIKLNTPVRKVVKSFFIGFAILDMSKHIITVSATVFSRTHSTTWSC